jgi:hypothetical protein
MYSCSLARFTPVGIDAGLRIIIPPNLVALIDEDFVVNLTGKHLELRVRNIFRGKLGVFLWRRCGITRTNNDIRRDHHLPQPRLVHAEPLNVARSHRKGRLHPIIAHIPGGFRVKAHLLAQIGRHHRVVLPTALVPQKQIGIDLGPTDPESGKSALRMPRHANLILVDVRSPNLVLEKIGEVQADIARRLQSLLRTYSALESYVFAR